MIVSVPPREPAPKYWMYEAGGLLRPAMERYIRREPLSPLDLALIAAYLRQWVASSLWDTFPDDNDPGIAERQKELQCLRKDAAELRDQDTIDAWVIRAVAFGMDPL